MLAGLVRHLLSFAIVAAKSDDDVIYLFLQKRKIGAKLHNTFRKVRTMRGCFEGLALMI